MKPKHKAILMDRKSEERKRAEAIRQLNKGYEAELKRQQQIGGG